MVAEDLGHQEVHQRPKLHYIVLEGRSREEKPPFRIEPEERLPALTLEVFDVLGLVENHIVPLLPAEGEVVLDDELV